ncbi:MAG: BamA/TamA family outer membrane protein [Alphaproteobacteria bacterium]|nr:BamA/TamA family outer membrane protein [Alphaproteobacteria bacterium]
MAFWLTLQRRLRLGLTAIVLSGLPLLAQAANAQGERVPVSGIPSSLKPDLRRLLREEQPPDSLFEARRQADRAAAVVSKLLESEGYYRAEVTPSAEGAETFTRKVQVTLGPLFVVESAKIEIEGQAEIDDKTRAKLDDLLSPLATGVPARAAPVLQIQDALVLALRNAGYPDARADPVDALADGRAQTMEFTFKLAPGARASFGDLHVAGLERTRPDFVDVLKPWKPGQRYSPQTLDEFRNRLAATGIFDSTTASLSETGEPGPNGLSEHDVDVRVTERKRHTIALGASASTSEGVGLEGQWTLRNVLGRGESLSVTAKAATLDSSLTTAWKRPAVGHHYGRDLTLQAKIENQETDAFNQLGGTLSATIDEQLTHRLRGSVGVTAGYASIEDDQTRLLGTGRRDVYIITTPTTAEYTGVRDILDPHNGVRARLAVEPGVTFGDTNIGFTKVTGEASVYADLGSSKLVGALRGKLGSILGPSGAPPDRLFFAGGGGSVRGYDYQSLSPRDSANNVVGGLSLVETSAELRWRATQTLGWVAFIDAGAAGTNRDPPIGDMRAGAGLGVRYYTSFGPLRADIAAPLDKRTGDSNFQIYISIGQAF